MSTGSQKDVDGIGEDRSDLLGYHTHVEYDPELARIMKEREAEIERILAQENRELIQQGIEAYKHDLPRLLAENRYRQKVAYRGNELVAFGATYRQLQKRLAKKGYTDRGELYITSIAPLQIEEDDDLER